MDLWIRSQNGEVLTKCNCLGLEEQSGSKWSVLNYDGLEFYQYLGAYDYERALEVLDEIQNILKPKIIVKSGKPVAETLDGVVYKTPDEVEIKVLSVVVYEMPEE